MIIEHDGKIIREIRLNEDISNENPQPWQFKPFSDITKIGVELMWPYKDYHFDKDDPPTEIEMKLKSQHMFSIIFPAHISVQEKYDFVILPHHTYFVSPNKKTPLPVLQAMEFDWWPGKLEVLFMKQPCVFKQNKPFAQAMVVPRRSTELKKMSKETQEQIQSADKFINENKDEYITRKVQIDSYDIQDNLYERLSHLNKSDNLPTEIKPKKRCVPKVRWK